MWGEKNTDKKNMGQKTRDRRAYKREYGKEMSGKIRMERKKMVHEKEGVSS